VAVELFDDAEIAATSHAFQTFINKTHDVRVTVAGLSIFGAAIHSTSHTGQVGWRSDYNSLRYTETAVPDAIKNSIKPLPASFQYPVWGVRFQRGPTGPLVVFGVQPQRAMGIHR
jgi:hypothetical protein